MAPPKVSIPKHWDKLEQHYEEICTLIENGKSRLEISLIFGVPKSAVSEFLTHPDRADRTRALEQLSADTFADMALAALDLPDDCTMAQVNLAKEKANHFRWLAMKKDPKRYGDKVQVDAQIEVKPKMSSDQLQQFISAMQQKVLARPVEANGDYLEFDESTDGKEERV